MELVFLDRKDEVRRLVRAFSGREGAFCCLYGRRRCGKSRLLLRALPPKRSAYYVADESEPALQRVALSRCLARMAPGFEKVTYPDWGSLLDRWHNDARPGSVLAVDEFPYLAAGSPELPSLFQKAVDRGKGKGLHFALCGSSQRMMQGLVLDAAAPLYGRAREILHVKPLPAGWLPEAMNIRRAIDALAAYAVWGGVPRYWELARGFPSTLAAAGDLVLDPKGVLYSEPRRLLLDDIRDAAQAASILALIGQGCRRLSEIASRLEKPSTSLSRPLQRLMELGFVTREYPFGMSDKDTKRTVYRIADPFLLFWFRYVQPNRSRLESGEIQNVQKEVEDGLTRHVGGVWEDLVRAAVPRLRVANQAWTCPARWWGADTEGKPMECDVLARSLDGTSLLVGEAKVNASARDVAAAFDGLERKARRLPFAGTFERIVPVVFVAGGHRGDSLGACLTAEDVFAVLK